jgi:hypothetical protein
MTVVKNGCTSGASGGSVFVRRQADAVDQDQLRQRAAGPLVAIRRDDLARRLHQSGARIDRGFGRAIGPLKHGAL